LFDQNLSPALVGRMADIYPGSTHVYSIGLDQASDLVVWNAAPNQGYTIATRDADFSDIASLLGYPPKVIWIRRGNCSTQEIEAILRLRFDALASFYGNPNLGILALY
jgi:predicted nuclease of predicted toxin-antitoxin system